MKKKFYGIVLVNRRLYILLLATLSYLLLSNIFNSIIGQKNLDQKINDIYGSQNIECIVEAVYHEARGETVDGWKAVVEVILNRVDNPRYPNTICEVVHQNKQFSYRNGNKKHNLKYYEPIPLYEITKTVYHHLYNIQKDDKNRVLPKCVTHYDGKSFDKPKWASHMRMVKEIGEHQFYCEK